MGSCVEGASVKDSGEMIKSSALKVQGKGRFLLFKMDWCQDIFGGSLSTLHWLFTEPSSANNIIFDLRTYFENRRSQILEEFNDVAKLKRYFIFQGEDVGMHAFRGFDSNRCDFVTICCGCLMEIGFLENTIGKHDSPTYNAMKSKLSFRSFSHLFLVISVTMS